VYVLNLLKEKNEILRKRDELRDDRCDLILLNEALNENLIFDKQKRTWQLMKSHPRNGKSLLVRKVPGFNEEINRLLSSSNTLKRKRDNVKLEVANLKHQIEMIGNTRRNIPSEPVEKPEVLELKVKALQLELLQVKWKYQKEFDTAKLQDKIYKGSIESENGNTHPCKDEDEL